MIYKYIFFLLSIASWAQISLKDYNLNGNVKSLKSTTYAIDKGYWEVSGFLDSEYFNQIELNFNYLGNIISKVQYLDYRGKLGIYDQTFYQYNSQNQLEKQKTILIQNQEEPERISQQKKYYYLGGQLIRMDELNLGLNNNQKWIFNYLYKNQKLTEKHTWMEDQIFSKTLFKYDFTNQLAETKDYTNNGKEIKRIVVTLDRGQQTKTVETSYGNETIIETYYYKNQNLLAYQKTNEAETLFEKIEFNEYQLINSVKKRKNNQNQLINFEFEYIYDKHNNWIECVITINHIPEYKIKRLITYF